MKEALKDLKIDSLQQQVVKLKLMDLAQDSIGMYPAAVNGKKRTAEMNGFNAALMEISNNREVAAKVFDHLNDEWKRQLSYLILNEVVELEVVCDPPAQIRPWVNVNDTFAPAADAEDIPWEDLKLVLAAHEKFGTDGVYAYVSHKRGVRPWRAEKFTAKHPQFDEALVWIGQQH